ncbi:MAG: asparaginase [Bacteroidales bacterium]|nr:asparaginase [Bacteroidales bacterium]
MNRPRILIIYTGGTIGMIEDPATRTLKPFDFNHLIDNVPKVQMLGYDIDSISFNPPIDSSDMNPAHWVQIVRTIEKHYREYDGFVVLHGTDTMAYTASAISFMLINLAKPVIITGSQLPIGEVRTDGEENLITALQIAAARTSKGRPMVEEVAILFEDYLWRGNRATKTSANNFNAFRSKNYPDLAKIGLGIYFNESVLYRVPADELDRPLRAHYNLVTDVAILTLFPGLTEATLRHQLNAPGLRGVVLRSYGAGNGPTGHWFSETIRDAVERGIVVMNVTQCVNGGVEKRYAAGDVLASAGVISGHDITVEAAITKMMVLLGLGLEPHELRQKLEKSLRGEMTVG